MDGGRLAAYNNGVSEGHYGDREMDVNDTRSIWEQWLWERRPLTAFVAATVLLPLAAALALYPAIGAKGLLLLSFCLIGLVSWMVYGVVGRKVQRLREAVPADEGEAGASLIVNGMLQSPGVAIMRPEALRLRPIVGQPVEVRWEEIESFREVRWFNGTCLLGKIGFWIDVPGRSRLGVALSATSAALLRQRLQERGVSP